MRSCHVLSPMSLLLVALVAGACGGTSVTQITNPSPLRCDVSVDGVPASVPSAGGRISATVLADRECVWSAATETGWLHPAPQNGQGEAPLDIVVDSNPDPRERTGVLTVNEVRMFIAQPAAGGATPVDPGTPPVDPSIRVNFKGRISHLAGVCPVLTFEAGKFVVHTDAQTRFTDARCTDLRDGAEAEIDGMATGNVVRATKVELKKSGA